MIFCRYKHTLLQSISVRSSTTRESKKKKGLLIILVLSSIDDQTMQLDEKRVYVKCHTVCFIHKYNIYLTKTSMKLICHFFFVFSNEIHYYIYICMARFRQKSFNWMIEMKKILLLYNHLTSLDRVHVLVLLFL